MFESIMNQYQQFILFANANPVVAGVISLWVLTVATFFLREVPKSIYLFIKRQLITSMTLNNSTSANQEMYHAFLSWSKEKGFLRFSRDYLISLPSVWSTANPKLTAGYGFHLFFHKGRMFWFYVTKLESSGSEKQKEEISLSTLGRNYKVLEDFLYEFKPDEDEEKRGFYTVIDGDWDHQRDLPTRNLDAMAMNPDMEKFAKQDVKDFFESEDWYRFRGIPYKYTTILHGIPGTGKTSLIKHIAAMYNKNICSVNLSLVSDSMLQRLLSSTPPNSIIAIEDFDANNTVKKRQSDGDEESGAGMLTLSGMLNAMDGISELDDVMLFLTTNHLERIDPAVYRKARVDKIIEVGYLQPAVVESYSKHIFPDADFTGYEFKETLGCELHEANVVAKNDVELYKKQLTNSIQERESNV